MSKTGETIALLHRHASLARTIYNTGAILEEAITPALGLRKLVWQPRHASPLSNQVLRRGQKKRVFETLALNQ